MLKKKNLKLYKTLMYLKILEKNQEPTKNPKNKSQKNPNALKHIYTKSFLNHKER